MPLASYGMIKELAEFIAMALPSMADTWKVSLAGELEETRMIRMLLNRGFVKTDSARSLLYIERAPRILI